MQLYKLAGDLTAWRGFKYYEQKKVLRFEKKGPGVYEGSVAGNDKNPYLVRVDDNDRYACRCTCPFALERGRICKHMIALSFEAEPEDAEVYFRERAIPLLKKDIKRQKTDAAIEEYIAGLDKLELQRLLLELLFERPPELRERFLREHTDFDLTE